MAATSSSTRSVRRATRGIPSMTERQLDAYLMARDTLRRLRDAGLLRSGAPVGAPPDRRP